LLEHLGYAEAGDALRSAAFTVLKDGGVLTADLGGNASTREFAAAVAAALESGQHT